MQQFVCDLHREYLAVEMQPGPVVWSKAEMGLKAEEAKCGSQTSTSLLSPTGREEWKT